MLNVTWPAAGFANCLVGAGDGLAFFAVPPATPAALVPAALRLRGGSSLGGLTSRSALSFFMMVLCSALKNAMRLSLRVGLRGTLTSWCLESSLFRG